MIRIRRVRSRLPFGRAYEVEIDSKDASEPRHRQVTRAPIRVLEPLLGIGDSWSFIDAADRAWAERKHGWAVEFEEHPD